MEKNIFALNLVFSLSTVLAFSALADTSSDTTGIANAQVVYSGTILEEATCTITESPGSVNLGTWMTSATSGIGSGLYSFSTSQAYNFIATCDASVNVQFKITASSVVKCYNTGALCVVPTGSDQATGVGVAIFARSPFTISGGGNTNELFYSSFVPNATIEDVYNYPITLSSGENVLSFSAGYRQTADTITAGSANVVVTITFRLLKDNINKYEKT